MIEDVVADDNDIIINLTWRVVAWAPDNSYSDISGITQLPEAINPVPYDELTEELFWKFIADAEQTTTEQMVIDLEQKLHKAMNPAPIVHKSKGSGNLPWLDNDGTGI